MSNAIEISGQLTQGLWDYNTIDLNGAVLPSVNIQRVASIAQHGFDAHELRLSTLSGTYVETAAHLIEGRPTIDQIPVSDLIRPARIMRLPIAKPYTLYRAGDLVRHDPGVRPGEALLIDTGWSLHWNQPGYVSEAPAFARSTLEWFLQQPFSILGLDTPVMECHWGDQVGVADETGKLLEPLYQRGMILLAPLVNLNRIDQLSGTLIAFPLNIVGVCSAPCRAVFFEGTPI
jgi:arylformamidase